MWLLAAMVSAGTLALSGCANDSAKQKRHDPSVQSDRFPDPETVRYREDQEPAPAPAPKKVEAAKPVEPKPQPKMAEAPKTGCSGVVYIPTGDRSSSGLMIEKSWPCEVQAGQEFTFDLCATNLTSTTSFSDVVVTDELPAGLRVIKVEPTLGGNYGMWSVGTLAPGEKRCLKVTAVASGPGSLTSCWTGRYALSQCITMNVTNPALKITKTMPAEVLLCDNIPIVIEVTNTGTGVARDVKVTDQLPAGLKTASGQSSVTLDAGSLAAGQSRKFDLLVKADKTGTYANQATAAAGGGLTATTTPVSTRVTQPVLTLRADCPPATLIGRSATFKLTVGNTGDAVSNNTVVTCAVPAGSTFVSATQGGTAGPGGVTWNVGALKPTESRTLEFTVRAGGIGTMAINATANGVCATAVTANCSTPIQGTPDIGTLLTDDDGVVLVGDNHIYRYEVENQGQVDLTNIRVVITLPEGMEFVSSTAPKPPQIDGRKLTFTGVIGVVKPGSGRQAFSLTCKATTAGEKLVISETTCDQIKTPIRDDELTVFVDR
jgi:uncharacterized repeat protein (TIGR01451 family)